MVDAPVKLRLKQTNFKINDSNSLKYIHNYHYFSKVAKTKKTKHILNNYLCCGFVKKVIFFCKFFSP